MPLRAQQLPLSLQLLQPRLLRTQKSSGLLDGIGTGGSLPQSNLPISLHLPSMVSPLRRLLRPLRHQLPALALLAQQYQKRAPIVVSSTLKMTVPRSQMVSSPGLFAVINLTVIRIRTCPFRRHNGSFPGEPYFPHHCTRCSSPSWICCNIQRSQCCRQRQHLPWPQYSKDI